MLKISDLLCSLDKNIVLKNIPKNFFTIVLMQELNALSRYQKELMEYVLILHDVAMVAADTTRTKYYLNELIRNELIPNYVLVLFNASKSCCQAKKRCWEKTN